MPLFGRKRQATAAQPAYAEPQAAPRHSGLFSRTPEPTYAEPRSSMGMHTAHPNSVPTNTHSSGGLFSHGTHRSSGASNDIDGRHHTTATTTAGTRSTRKSGGLFSRRSRATAAPIPATTSQYHSPGTSPTGHRTGGGLFGRNKHVDPSVETARHHVLSAERAELEAQRAHAEAQSAVGAARREVKQLEREAEVEAKMAKAKKHESKSLSKRAGPLGRRLRG